MPFADTSSPNSPPLFKASLDLRLLSISVVFKSSSQPLWPNACPPQSPSLHFLQHDSPVAPSSVVSKTSFNTQ
jgi:hypothetical protein